MIVVNWFATWPWNFLQNFVPAILLYCVLPRSILLIVDLEQAHLSYQCLQLHFFLLIHEHCDTCWYHQPFHYQDLIGNFPHCLQCNCFNVSLENVVLDLPIILKSIFSLLVYLRLYWHRKEKFCLGHLRES